MGTQVPIPRTYLQLTSNVHSHPQFTIKSQGFPVRVTELTDTEATIDMNHPLAGKNLKVARPVHLSSL